ncbi:MAG TPA: GldM family protein, partial [Bacteroidales bacterium]|nr:GldM family protein [Bacteroidales bacterium]
MKNTISILFVIISFSSFGQKFTISSTRQNILYKGLENPIEIIVEDLKCKNIGVSTTNGKIEKYAECSYIFKADTIGEANISVYRKNKNDSILLGTYYFKVKNIPNPTPRLIDKRSGEVENSLL